MSVDFDGSLDQLRVAYTAPTPPFTFAYWFRCDAATASMNTVGFRSGFDYWTTGVGGAAAGDPMFIAAQKSINGINKEHVTITSTGITVGQWHAAIARISDVGGIQYGVPISDISLGTWVQTVGDGNATAWEELDDGFTAGAGHVGAPDDGTTAWNSAGNPSSDTIECQIDSLIDPSGNTGHIIKTRLWKNATGGSTLEAIVSLYQGTTLIEAFTHSDVSNTKTTFTDTISGTQADTITDYTDLRIRVVANTTTASTGRAMICSAMQFECPGGTSRKLQLDTASEVESLVSKIPSGADFLEVGASLATVAQPFNGQIAWLAIWDVLLTDAEADDFASGTDPRLIRPAELREVFPLYGNSTHESLITGTEITPVSAPPHSSQSPPVFPYSRRRGIFVPAAAAGGLGIPIAAYHHFHHNLSQT